MRRRGSQAFATLQLSLGSEPEDAGQDLDVQAGAPACFN